MLRIARVWVATMVMASGGLLYAASWQRWAGACPWSGDQATEACGTRMDHRYGFLPPWEPWTPVGMAAELAGASLLLLALALFAWPPAWAEPKPGPVGTVALLAAVLIVADVGLATLRSGLAGAVVSPVAPDAVIWLWLFVPPLLFVYLWAVSGGWASGAAALLILASPLVASGSYAIGPWDAAPWWEAISGLLTCAAGLCVLVEAISRTARRSATEVEPAVPS